RMPQPVAVIKRATEATRRANPIIGVGSFTVAHLHSQWPEKELDATVLCVAFLGVLHTVAVSGGKSRGADAVLGDSGRDEGLGNRLGAVIAQLQVMAVASPGVGMAGQSDLELWVLL